MAKVVSWNIGKREKPWRELAQMASEGDADLALLQEAGSPPGDLVDRIEYVDGVFWNRHLYDRWPLVVKLSDRITVEPYRQVPPILIGRPVETTTRSWSAAPRPAPLAHRPHHSTRACRRPDPPSLW